jgi:hypothetical protein
MPSTIATTFHHEVVSVDRCSAFQPVRFQCALGDVLDQLRVYLAGRVIQPRIIKGT